MVQIARDAGLVKMGTLAVDGSKIRANASKRKAMSYGPGAESPPDGTHDPLGMKTTGGAQKPRRSRGPITARAIESATLFHGNHAPGRGSGGHPAARGAEQSPRRGSPAGFAAPTYIAFDLRSARTPVPPRWRGGASGGIRESIPAAATRAIRRYRVTRRSHAWSSARSSTG